MFYVEDEASPGSQLPVAINGTDPATPFISVGKKVTLMARQPLMKFIYLMRVQCFPYRILLSLH